ACAPPRPRTGVRASVSQFGTGVRPMSHPRETGTRMPGRLAGLHVERPAWLANDGAVSCDGQAVTEEATFWSRLTWVSLVRGILRIVVNKAENIPVVRLRL